MLRIPPPGVPIGPSALACGLLLLLQTTCIHTLSSYIHFTPHMTLRPCIRLTIGLVLNNGSNTCVLIITIRPPGHHCLRPPSLRPAPTRTSLKYSLPRISWIRLPHLNPVPTRILPTSSTYDPFIRPFHSSWRTQPCPASLRNKQPPYKHS